MYKYYSVFGMSKLSLYNKVTTSPLVFYLPMAVLQDVFDPLEATICVHCVFGVEVSAEQDQVSRVCGEVRRWLF